MPEMDGLTATTKMRQGQRNMEKPWIIALTANAMREQQKACLDARMNDYLSKPVTIQGMAQPILRSPFVSNSTVIIAQTPLTWIKKHSIIHRV